MTAGLSKETQAIHLPADIYRQIFKAAAARPKEFPSFPRCIPIQFILSSVCTEWRRIVHSTTDLWNYIKIINIPSESDDYDFYHEWLKKAGGRPVTLGFDLHSLFFKIKAIDFVTIVERIMSLPDLKVGKLQFCISQEQLFALQYLSPEVVEHLDILELDFSPIFFELKETLEDISEHLSEDFSNLLSRTRSLVSVQFKPENARDLLMYQFPWDRLCRLDCAFENMTPKQVNQILQHMPLLEELHISASIQPDSPDIPPGTILLPHLRILAMNLSGLPTESFPFFYCPNLNNLEIDLVNLDIEYMDSNVIGRICDQRKLERFVFENSEQLVPMFTLSTFLKEAPSLREFSVGYGILDDGAIAGIATGELGRFLELLDIGISSDPDIILNMLEARLQAAENSIKNGRTWRDMVSSLKKVNFWGKNAKIGRHKKRIEALRKVGLQIAFHVVK